ncbi:MAG: alpha/beta hydrolase [Candidatus Brocadiales bacterium]
MTEERVCFNSGGMQLEGVLGYEENLTAPPVALVCPPHPNLGGDMDNNVIMALARELSTGGYVTLRFNYRGIGGSEGPFKTVAEKFRYWESTFGEGNLEGPLEDTKSALAFLKSSVRACYAGRGIPRAFIVGYSFGAVMGMRVGVTDDAVVALAGIAAPCAVYNLDFLSHSQKPKLFICSDSDFATSVEDTRRAFEKFSEPKRLVVKTNVSHFYTGSEQEVAREVLFFFNNVL